MGVQAIGDDVSEESVDFLGHRAVPRTKPRLDMSDRYPQLAAHERTGERGVDVPHDHDAVGTLREAATLELHKEAGGLFGMRSAANPQIPIGLRDREILKNLIAEFGIVVLSGVDKERAQRAIVTEGSQDRRNFGKVRASSDNKADGESTHGAEG